MFKEKDNLILRGAEYAGKYKVNQTVDYDPSFYRCESVLVNGPWDTISNISRGLNKPVCDLIYYQYVQRLGINSKTIEKVKKLSPPENRFTSADLPSWGDLLWPYRAASSKMQKPATMKCSVSAKEY